MDRHTGVLRESHPHGSLNHLWGHFFWVSFGQSFWFVWVWICTWYISGSSYVVVLLLSCVRLFATPWTAAHQASLSFTSSQSLLKLMSIESVMLSNHLILCHPFLLLPSIFPSIRVFSKESVLYIRWPKYWSFSFSIGPSHEYSGLISFRMYWFDLLAVQGTLQSLLQHQMCSHKSLSQGGFQQRGLWVALASLFFWPARKLLVKKGSLTLRMTNT